MKMNTYHWQLYLLAGGQKIVECFESCLRGDWQILRDLADALFSAYCPDPFLAQSVRESIDAFVACPHDYEEIISPKSPYCYEDIADEWWEEIAQVFADVDQQPLTDRFIFEAFAQDIVYNSLLVTQALPDGFIPYFFPCCYHVLMSISEMFDIELPKIPGQRDYAGRFRHYFEICKRLREERESMQWSPAELCAFLYDFAPKSIGGLNWLWKHLPEPRAVFVSGSSPTEPALAQTKNTKDVVCWQGHPDAQPGDIILLYHWAPESRFSSVWRAVAPGFIDPFFIFYRCVYIGAAIPIEGPTFQTLKADPVWNKHSLVKTRMLRMDGQQIMPSEYMYFVDMLRQTGNDVSKLPVFDMCFKKNISSLEIETERDVEMYLLEPLLERLGWKKNQYVRQMPLRMGRGHLVYPDYVILPKFTPGYERAYWIIEAKKSIPTKKQLQTDCAQAVSYALRLNASGFMLVAKEGVWISQKGDDFNNIHFYRWEDMQKNQDVFADLYKKAGNCKRKRLESQ